MQATFHYIWLRDNCRCLVCGDKSGGHRYLELNDIPLDVVPAQATTTNSNALEIIWAPDGHQTRFDFDWLRDNAYCEPARLGRRHRPVLWDAELTTSLTGYSYPNVIEDRRHRLAMFDHVYNYGFALLRDVPVKNDEIEHLASLVGYIRETHYGRVFDLISTPEKRILAETSHAIRPHHDELFRDPTPGIIIMHCLLASEDGGGESILVDGFNAANALLQSDPCGYDLLTRVPVTHHRVLTDGVDNVALRAVWQTITLDYGGEVTAVRLNERTMAPLDVPENLVEATYAALQKLYGLIYDSKAGIRFLLEPGDAVMFDNHRVLHARTAFGSDRHIRQCHVDRDEFFSRRRTLTRALTS